MSFMPVKRGLLYPCERLEHFLSPECSTDTTVKITQWFCEGKPYASWELEIYTLEGNCSFRISPEGEFIFSNKVPLELWQSLKSVFLNHIWDNFILCYTMQEKDLT